MNISYHVSGNRGRGTRCCARSEDKAAPIGGLVREAIPPGLRPNLSARRRRLVADAAAGTLLTAQGQTALPTTDIIHKATKSPLEKGMD